MAEKHQDGTGDAAALLDDAQLALALHIDSEVRAYKADADDAAHVSGEKRAKRLIALGRAIAVARQAGPKPASSSPEPTPPANENEDMTQADDPDGLDHLSDEDLRARVVDRLERFARQLETKRLGLYAGSRGDESHPDGMGGPGERRAAS